MKITRFILAVYSDYENKDQQLEHITNLKQITETFPDYFIGIQNQLFFEENKEEFLALHKEIEWLKSKDLVIGHLTVEYENLKSKMNLFKICVNNKIELIIPFSDEEAECLSDNIKIFTKKNIKIMVNDFKCIKLISG